MAATPHIHIGFIEGLIFLLYLVVIGFILRVVEIQFHNTALGRGLSFIY